jgi:hypothetical protein
MFLDKGDIRVWVHTLWVNYVVTPRRDVTGMIDVFRLVNHYARIKWSNIPMEKPPFLAAISFAKWQFLSCSFKAMSVYGRV